MPAPHVRLRSLQVARACAQLGASSRTLELLTGLPKATLRRDVFSGNVPRGRPRHAADAFERSTWPRRLQLSAFAAKFHSLRTLGFGRSESLLASYRHFLSYAPTPAISFDEAFFLVCLLEGAYGHDSARLRLVQCSECSGRYVSLYLRTRDHCPYCRPPPPRIVARMAQEVDPCDRGVRAHPTSLGYGDTRCDPLQFQSEIERRGASPRTVRMLMQGMPGATFDTLPTRADGAAASSHRCPHRSWSRSVRATWRAQASSAVTLYRNLVQRGVEPHWAFLLAHEHATAPVGPADKLGIDRLARYFAEIDSPWRRRGPVCLEMVTCTVCGLEHLASTTEKEIPNCPFCALAGQEQDSEVVSHVPG